MAKTLQSIINEALVDKCFVYKNDNSYYYIQEFDDTIMRALISTYNEFISSDSLDINDCGDLELVSKEEFLENTIKYLKSCIRYNK